MAKPTTRKSCRRKSRKSRKTPNKCFSMRRYGGSLGRIPAMATVSIQQDPYSARMLVDAETAEDVFDARGPYLL